jgi:hypothetical protein
MKPPSSLTRNRQVAAISSTLTVSFLTPCWRRMDSNCQFRDASQPPTAVNDDSSRRRNSSIGLPRPTTARMIPPRRRSIGPNSAEASKLLPISRGTGSSNPFPSSGESCANLPRAGIRLSRSRSHDRAGPGTAPVRRQRRYIEHSGYATRKLLTGSAQPAAPLPHAPSPRACSQSLEPAGRHARSRGVPSAAVRPPPVRCESLV